MKHISKRSRSFIILVVVVLATVYTALLLFSIQRNYTSPVRLTTQSESRLSSSIDTQDWQIVESKEYPISFSIPTNWKSAESAAAGDIYQITITPPTQGNPIRIYISDTNFLGIDGLTTSNITTKQGYKGIVAANSLYGIKNGDYFYTLDGTLNESRIEELKAIVNSIRFN